MRQEIDNNVLDLVKQKGFDSYENMSDFEKFKEELTNKEKICSSLTDRKNSDREYEHALNFWIKFELKRMKIIMTCI